MQFLPYGRQVLDDEDVAAVVAALRGDFLTTGPLVDRFEAAVAEATGAEHCVACSSGTAALHLSAMALDLGPGQAVVVPTLTFLATANVVRMTGAEVVFADVDADSGLMTPETLRDALQRIPPELRAAAAFPVHLNGQTADMRGLAEVAADHGLALVEDACHALGTVGNSGERVGSCRYSAMATFSFHAVKTVTTAEGGAVTVRDPETAARLRRLRSHGMVRSARSFTSPDLALDANGDANPWYYEMPEVGYNYRIADINCALGLSQLEKLGDFARARARLVAQYDRELKGQNWVRPIRRTGGIPVWHLYVALIDFESAGVGRAAVMHELWRHGVGTQVHYLPVHLQPYYRRRYGNLELPEAWAYYRRCLSLPLFPSMGETDCHRVVSALQSILEG